MSSKQTPPDAGLDNKSMQIACERLAKILGLTSRDELLKFAREVFPSQPSCVVIGEYADGESYAFLVEGESTQAVSQLLDEYLVLLGQGADPIEGAPRCSSFSLKHVWPCSSMPLVTRCEVDAVRRQVAVPTR